MAIKNIVFDLGNVLIDFDPLTYLRSFGFPEETVQMLMQVIFAAEWNRYDRGDYLHIEDLRDALTEKHPALADAFHKVLRPDWVHVHTLKTDTAAYLAELKSRGYKIYLLSNLATESYQFVQRYDFFHQADGGVFSYQERVCKPEETIYRILLERYALKAEETVFLDDAAANIEAARHNGMHGIVFSGFAAAKEQLEALLTKEGSIKNRCY